MPIKPNSKSTWTRMVSTDSPHHHSERSRGIYPAAVRGATYRKRSRCVAASARLTLYFSSVIAAIALSYSAQAQEFTDPGDVADAFLDRMVHGEFDQARDQFDSPMKSAMPDDSLKETWDVFTGLTGSFIEIVDVRREIAGMFHIVIITCRFERSLEDIKIVVNNAMEVSGLFFLPPPENDEPPEYANPERYTESEVEVGTGDWVLPGTLTMPNGDGPFPAVVLVHGSGPQDRDETIGANKPFRDLAWGLATQGIAVLRYEKRTKHYQSKLLSVPANFTVNDETIDDAAAAVNTLRFTPKIDNQRITVIGHSLGGTLAPRIAKKNTAVTGLIILAGSTRPLGEILLEQLEYVFGLDGKIAKEEQQALQKTRAQVTMMHDPNLSETTPANALPFGVPAKYWLDLRAYNPVETTESLNIPTLILQGGRDYQVTEKDFVGWKNGIKNTERVAYKLLPNLNHLFMAGEGKSTPNEYAIAGHVDEAVIQLIAKWIQNRS